METKDLLDVLRKRLIDAGFTDYDLSDDSVLMDITAKVFGILVAPLDEQMDFIEQGQSIKNEMSTDQMDALIANVFLERRQGAKAKATVSVYFTSQVDLTVLAATNYFSTKSGQKFYPQADYYFYQHQMQPETILGVSYYRYDIPTIAEAVGESYEVSAGEIVDGNISVPYFSHVINRFDATGGVDSEDNTAAVTSAMRAIATRDNVMKDSLWTVFMQKYGDIVDMYTVGYLDEEMQRDVSRASWCWYGHRGGMSDVYMKNKLSTVSTSCQAVEVTATEPLVEFTDMDEETVSNMVYIDEDAYDAAVTAESLFIIRVRGDVRYNYKWVPYETIYPTATGELPNYVPAPLAYNLSVTMGEADVPVVAVKVRDKHHRFSTREAVDYYVVLSNLYAGESISVSYFTNSSLENYQADIVTPEMRPIVADTLFKNFIPIVINELKITYVSNPTIPVVKKDIEEIITNYLFNYIGTDPIYISEIIELVVNKTGIILPEIGTRNALPTLTQDTIASSPFYVDYTQHNIDCSTITTRSTQVLSAINNPLLSSSDNTCRYYLAPDFLTLVNGGA